VINRGLFPIRPSRQSELAAVRSEHRSHLPQDHQSNVPSLVLVSLAGLVLLRRHLETSLVYGGHNLKRHFIEFFPTLDALGKFRACALDRVSYDFKGGVFVHAKASSFALSIAA
jgi:hypothetical protein